MRIITRGYGIRHLIITRGFLLGSPIFTEPERMFSASLEKPKINAGLEKANIYVAGREKPNIYRAKYLIEIG